MGEAAADAEASATRPQSAWDIQVWGCTVATHGDAGPVCGRSEWFVQIHNRDSAPYFYFETFDAHTGARLGSTPDCL